MNVKCVPSTHDVKGLSPFQLSEFELRIRSASTNNERIQWFPPDSEWSARRRNRVVRSCPWMPVVLAVKVARRCCCDCSNPTSLTFISALDSEWPACIHGPTRPCYCTAPDSMSCPSSMSSAVQRRVVSPLAQSDVPSHCNNGFNGARIETI